MGVEQYERIEEQLRGTLGFSVTRHQVLFEDRDENLHPVPGVDLLGRAKSGARPATPQEDVLWENLTAALRGLGVMADRVTVLEAELREARVQARTQPG